MSKPLKKHTFKSSYQDCCEQNHSYYDYVEAPIRKKPSLKRIKKQKRPNVFLKFFALLLAMAFVGVWGYYVCPYNYNNYIRPLFLNRFLNRNINLDIEPYILPTTNYFYNSILLNQRLLVSPLEKTKEITDMTIVSELQETKIKLLELFKQYPKLEPSVFVWEYSTGYGLEINSDKVYPSASIIKIPIAFELIRLVDKTSKTINPITLTDKRMFTEEYRTLGSGDLQKTRANVPYTLDYLANIMIANSDNSATNMLLYEIGGKDGFNRAMRNLGLRNVSMSDWLPDLDGTNKITAREISKILYNIDNPNYINPKYKNILKEYLGNTKNTHLLKEKLPSDLMVLHKTGDIASMLGDSGIVYTNNGKKYIVTILVKRPHNDFGAKILIQDASLIIFNDIKSLL